MSKGFFAYLFLIQVFFRLMKGDLMAGSLCHIVNWDEEESEGDGTFQMDLIENLGDAYEALEECFDVIAHLSDGDPSEACISLGYRSPAHRMISPRSIVAKREDRC